MCFTGAVELRNALQTALGTEISATATFDYGTISLLTTYLMANETLEGEHQPLGEPSDASHTQKILQELHRIVTNALGVVVASDQPLLEAGVDSLGMYVSAACSNLWSFRSGTVYPAAHRGAGAVEISNAISNHFNIPTSATIVFDHPSIDAIAAHLTMTLTATLPHDGGNMPSAWVGSVPTPAQLPSEAFITTLAALSSNFPKNIQGKSIQMGPVMVVQHQQVSDLPLPLHHFTDANLFWTAAMSGADLQTAVPFQRWNVEAGYHPSTIPQGMSIYVRFAAFCSGERDLQTSGPAAMVG